jgi:uncharacterized membrane protein (DUF106 family)
MPLGFFDFLKKFPGGQELLNEFNKEIQEFLKVWKEHCEMDKKEHQEILAKLNEISKKLEERK